MQITGTVSFGFPTAVPSGEMIRVPSIPGASAALANYLGGGVIRITAAGTCTLANTANLIADVLDNPRDVSNIEAVRAKVNALTARFPVYR